MSKKVLMIDDDLDWLDAVQTLLEAKGYEVKTAENGNDGFSLALEFMPDLILLKLLLPEYFSRSLHP